MACFPRGTTADIDAAVPTPNRAIAAGTRCSRSSARRSSPKWRGCCARREPLARLETADTGKAARRLAGRRRNLCALFEYFAGSADKIFGEG
ncbi:hypothetical protein [Ottowia sp.]|uniref:hypothetical protein n=1 Tax=Ottowia sp. TaxID=1898956 RepID=UPI00345627B5